MKLLAGFIIRREIIDYNALNSVVWDFEHKTMLCSFMLCNALLQGLYTVPRVR